MESSSCHVGMLYITREVVLHIYASLKAHCEFQKNLHAIFLLLGVMFQLITDIIILSFIWIIIRLNQPQEVLLYKIYLT